MASQTPKRFLYVNRKAPHGRIYAQEALEALLVAAAFEQDVSVLFADDGVYQIAKGQHTEAIGAKDFARGFAAIGGYGVEKVYVEEESMRARGLRAEDLSIEVEVLTAAEVGELMANQDVILSF